MNSNAAPIRKEIRQNERLPTKEGMSENNVSTHNFNGHLNNALLERVFVHNKRLWLDEHGAARISYAVGTTSHLSAEDAASLRAVLITVLQTAKLWTDQTEGCVQFVQLSSETCSKPEILDHGVIHINIFQPKCCSTYFGMQYGQEDGAKKCQDMCIDRRDCTETEIKKLVSNTLGLLSPINRPDRNDYIAFHPELLSEKLWPPLSFSDKPRWLSLQRCSSTAVSMDVPVPYDFLSTLHPVTSQYSDSVGDPQGVMVTQDDTKQYLLDHRYAACPELSHLDIYQVRKAYGCDTKFARDCQDTPPKCLNYGYLKKDCTCACTKYFGGSRCEKRIDDGPVFCSGNAWFLNVNATGLYDTTNLGMRLNDNISLAPGNGNRLMRFMQFLTVSVQLAELGKHVSVALSHSTPQTVITKLQTRLVFFIENINMTECGLHSGGFVIYWGASLSKHIRSWCFSSLLLNEPSAMVLRSRVPGTLDLAFRSSLGIITEDAQLSLDALRLQLEVSSFGVMNGSWVGSRGGEGGGGATPSPGVMGNRSTAEALTAAGAGSGVLLIATATAVALLLLALIGGLAAWTWGRADDGEGDYSEEPEDLDSEEREDLSSEEPEGDEALEDEAQKSGGALESGGQTQEAAEAGDDGEVT